MHLDFVVPKIEPAVARAQNAGARLESEVRIERWGRIAAMADPFGHGFCLIEFLGRGYENRNLNHTPRDTAARRR